MNRLGRRVVALAQVGAEAGHAQPALAADGLIDDAQHGRAAVQQRDQRAEGGQPRDEGLGAVDRVQHPHVLGVRPLRAELLADDAVLRPAGGDQLAHGRLRRPIGDGDRAGVGLRLDLQALAEVGPDSRAGDVGQLLGEGPEGSDVGGGGSVGHGTIVCGWGGRSQLSGVRRGERTSRPGA